MRTSYSTVVQKVSKTPNEVAAQIERWFLLYHKTEKAAFNGAETFTIFDLLCPEKQNALIKAVELDKHEIPVLVLFLGNNECILNTTERFIHISNAGTSSLYYPEFDGPNGFKAFGPGQMDNHMVVSIKKEGKLAEFGLKKKDGEVVYWPVPTGKPGFAFWNVSDRFKIIGRRFVIKKKK
jgi:hypothetical protein